MDVILSIKPKYVDAILSGEKKYEFRKTIFKNKNVDHVYIYSSSPVKRIVAIFNVGDIIEDNPKALWDRCKDQSGINDIDFFKYFTDNRKGFAIEIDNLEKLKTPIDPKKIMPGFVPPQSFCYVETPLLPKGINYSNEKNKTMKNNHIKYQGKSTFQANLTKFELILKSHL
jgi:type I restriction enzyme S subunit